MRRLALLTLLAPVLGGCSGAPVEPVEPVEGAERAVATKRPAPVRIARIVDFQYVPRRITVRSGTRIRWVNADISNHTVSFRRGPGELGDVDPGRALSGRFSRPGTYRYICLYHPSMVARVVVRR